MSARQEEESSDAARALATLAHDVNNLLAVILLTAADLASRSSGEEARLVAEIVVASKSAAAMVRRFDPQTRSVLEGVDVNAVVSRISALLQRIVSPSASLVLRLEAGLPNAAVDPIDLERALVNLVSNSGDALTPGGEVFVVTERAPDGGVVVVVEDDGGGMDEATRARAVEPFFSTSEHPRRGLGLASVADAVRRARGRLEIISSLGAGARVKMWFPAHE